MNYHRQAARDHADTGNVSLFDVSDYLLVARNDFHAGEKLALRWHGPRRIFKAVGDYVFTVEYLRNGYFSDVHGPRIKFFSDLFLD